MEKEAGESRSSTQVLAFKTLIERVGVPTSHIHFCKGTKHLATDKFDSRRAEAISA